MHSHTDHGYPSPAFSMRCIACGSMELNCCDGHGRKVKTSCQFPPIPDRRFDWLAYFDGDEEGPQGWGETEADAVADLFATIAA